MFDHLEAVGRFVGEALSAAGHRGPAGVDALVYREHDGALRLKPIVEVNPRYTQGHIALGLGKQLSGRGEGRYRIVTRATAKRAGFDSLGAYADGLAEALICLTDPERAREALAVIDIRPSP